MKFSVKKPIFLYRTHLHHYHIYRIRPSLRSIPHHRCTHTRHHPHHKIRVGKQILDPLKAQKIFSKDYINKYFFKMNYNWIFYSSSSPFCRFHPNFSRTIRGGNHWFRCRNFDLPNFDDSRMRMTGTLLYTDHSRKDREYIRQLES